MSFRDRLTRNTIAAIRITAITLGVWIIGSTASWILLFRLVGEVQQMVAIAGQSGFLVQALLYLLTVSIGLLFAIGFPIAFFLAGKLYAVQGTVNQVFTESRTLFLDYFLKKMILFIEKTKRKDGSAGLAEMMVAQADTYIQRMKGIPKPLQWLFDTIWSRAAVVEELNLALQEARETGMDREALVGSVADRVATKLEKNVFPVDTTLLRILPVVMIAVYLIVKLLF